MNLLHRSAKRLLRTHSISLPTLAEIPLQCVLPRFLLEEESAQKNIIDNICTRCFSVFAGDHLHETALKNQQQELLSIDGGSDVPLSQHTHIGISEERKCLEHGNLELAGGKTIIELVVADAGTISHKGKHFDSVTSELVQTNFVSKQKEGNKHFDGGAVELAIFDPCKASCKDTSKEKHLDDSTGEYASEMVQTTKFPSKDKQAHIVNDSTSEVLVWNIKSRSQKHNEELTGNEGLKLSIDHTETGLEREDIGMLKLKDSSEVCVRETKTSSKKIAREGTRNDFCGFLKGMGASEKVEFFTKEQVLVSRPHKGDDFAMLKIKKNKKNKKKKKKKNTNPQLGPEDLKHLSLTPHIAASGQSSCKEKLKMHGESSTDAFTCLPNYSSMQSKIIISPVARQESSESVCLNDSRTMEALKRKDKEKRESADAIFAERRQINQDITNGSVEEKQKLFICENSSKSRLHQDQNVLKCQDTQHRTEQIWIFVEKGPLNRQEFAHRPPLLVEKEQACLDALPHSEAIDKGSPSQITLTGKWQNVHSAVIKEKMIDYNQIKDGTFLDPPLNYWERVRKVGTSGCALERAEWDLAGVRKVHYPLKNYRELYIILDLNGVLIKRWDKNPSLPGVCKLNKKWIQLRPGCIEFLRKAFSSFKVGIWSTMTQKNALNVCNFLEQQAHQTLPFFMLWSKDSCYQHRGIQRPNKANVVADFKPLSRVWGYFKPYLGFHNTVLVDDSPYKACMNNPCNCIFPDAFEGYTDDKYLNDVLWPYLEKMRMSCNVQAYIANNPLGQLPVVVGHELYHHVQQVMDVFDYRASSLRAA